MTDTFDALREADNARIDWIDAARAFEKAIAQVHDPRTRENLERQWGMAASNRLAPARTGWELVRDVLNEIYLEAPLTPQEARDGGMPVGLAFDELRSWVAARMQRTNDYFGAAIEIPAEFTDQED